MTGTGEKISTESKADHIGKTIDFIQEAAREDGDQRSRLAYWLEEFESALRSKLLVDNDTSGLRISKAITEFFKSEDYGEFQIKDLGVLAGGFGLSHNRRQNFILLQSTAITAVDLEPDLRGVDIPHPSMKEREKDFVDYLFIGRAREQPLSSYNEHVFAPEFYWHLARAYKDGLEDEMCPFPESELDRFLHQQKSRLPYLYCPVGEVLFFLFAWRLLFRHAQFAGDGSTVLEESTVTADPDNTFVPTDVWQESKWPSDSRPENDWLAALNWLKERVQKPGKSLVVRHGDETDKARFLKFRENVLEEWNRWNGLLDLKPGSYWVAGHPWLSDWFNLGLVDHDDLDGLPRVLHNRGDNREKPIGPVAAIASARPTPALLSMVQFASRALRAGLDPKSPTFLGIDSKEYIDDLYNMEGCERLIWAFLKSDSLSTLGEGTYGEEPFGNCFLALDRSLRRTALALLRSRARSGKPVDLISTLHQFARFPIIPFFYWTVMDRKPKEHFVFPICESWQFSVEVKVPKHRSDGTIVPTTVALPATGLCLLGIEPLKEPKGSAFVNPSPGGDNDQAAAYLDQLHTRLFFIASFFSRIGRPFIDSAYYGTLVRDAEREKAEAHGRAKEEEIQITKWAHALRTRLVPLEILLNKGKTDLAATNLKLLYDAIDTLTELPELNEIGGDLSQYCQARGLTKSQFTHFERSDDVPKPTIDSFHSFLGVPIQAVLAKIVSDSEKFGTFFDRFGVDKDIWKPKLLDIVTKRITAKTWSEVTSTLHACNVQIEIEGKDAKIDNYDPCLTLIGEDGRPRLNVGMFIIMLIDELLSNAIKHSDLLEDDSKKTTPAYVRARFTLTGRSNDALCCLELVNQSNLPVGLDTDSPARRVGSGMKFLKMIAEAMNVGLYEPAHFVPPNMVRARYSFPVIFRR